jgi:SAM-dependent methyltransferase
VPSRGSLITMLAAVSFPTSAPLETCPCCGQSARQPHLRTRDFHYGLAGEFSTMRCSGCGLVFMDPMPSVADLAALYPEDYYSFRPPQLQPTWRRAVKRWFGLQRYTYLPHFEKPGRMLDLGCGSGDYMLEMKARGWETYGSELSASAAAAGRRARLDIRSGELRTAGFPSEYFDFVRLNHSLEHIPNPLEVLPEVRRVLKPGGKLFIGVPNINGLWARVFGRYWWYLTLPVHAFQYSPATLTMLLERTGFKVLEVRFNSDAGGNLGSIQLYLKRNSALPAEGVLVRSLVLRPFATAISKLLDLLNAGDCMEVIATRAEV